MYLVTEVEKRPVDLLQILPMRQPDIAQTISALPSSLQSSVENGWQTYIAACADQSPVFTDDVGNSLAGVWAGSDFIVRQCQRAPAMLPDLQDSGDLTQVYADDGYITRLNVMLDGVQGKDELAARLRKFRNREMVRIIWRDLAGWADLPEVTRDMSHLAEACIDGALSRLHAWMSAELGTPVDAGGEVLQLVVLGMGKLGAWELNVSSDIDLIFAYPAEGEVQGGKAMANSEYFSRLGKALIQSLSNATADGFVFRVDMRLRPFGEGGPLVVSFDALENYYLVHGREWERYAMIKARVVAGDRLAGQQLMEMLRPFIYRRYLDYGAYASLREMKAMVDQEVRRKGIANNVKLGLGGIREIEFIGQVFQLIRGGQEPALRERRILRVLEILQQNDVLPAYVVKELLAAYDFLRRVEHRLQGWADQQTHNLPEDATGQTRLAFSMGFADWASFSKVLQTHRNKVQNHFEQVFQAPQSEEANQAELGLTRLWFGRLDEQEAADMLATQGFREPAEVVQRLQVLRTGRSYRSLSSQGQERMDRLIPLLLGAITHAADPDTTFSRIIALIEAVTRRTVYLSLLAENPIALSQLVRLCAASPWLARYLTQNPMLLDELMDPRSLYAPPEKNQLADELRRRIAAIDPRDEESLLHALRHFKHLNVLRVAAADIGGALPLMKVSDHLTWIAEVVLDETLELAWRHMTTRHGMPVCRSDGKVCDKGFAIIGYGKLGGLELGYGSDLDMVFIHGADDPDQMTTGEHPIAASLFFARLGQRLIHLLTVLTPAGTLYDVDMRLRPDGASGMLVTGLAAFARYQTDKAWTWEHQALVRARFIAGDGEIARRFEEIRHEVLGRPRDSEALRKEVLEMRERMRKELDKGKADNFDLKQGPGGIVDIEFMVQYGVLARAHEFQTLLTYTDNIRILMVLAAEGLMSNEQADSLTQAYRAYRGQLHRLTLDERPGLVAAGTFAEQRTAVQTIWQTWLAAGPAGD